MMRAALILVGIGSLVAMEFGTPPRVANAVDQPLAPSTLGIGDAADPLAKADRLEIPYFQNELPAQPNSFVERTPPAESRPVIPKEVPRIVSGNRRDAKTEKVFFVHPKPRPKNPDSRPKPRITDSRTVANTSRSKPAVEVKPCRPNPFDSFLKALNLSSGCET
jgi:hypothetical protein